VLYSVIEDFLGNPRKRITLRPSSIVAGGPLPKWRQGLQLTGGLT
jgi:hypothetical protein